MAVNLFVGESDCRTELIGAMLTYMSLSDDIKARVTKLADETPPKLHFFSPSVDIPEGEGRYLVLTDDIMSAISEPWPDHMEDRHAELLTTFDQWVEEDEFTVSEKPKDHPRSTMLARTDPTEIEIWDMRCVDVDDGIRCLGAFADKNVFIALLWHYREDIGNEPGDFDKWVLEGRKVWDALFPGLAPYSAGTLDGYLSKHRVLKAPRRRRANAKKR